MGLDVVVGTKRRAGIQSVEIGMSVLTALAELGRPSQLSAVVKACGLSPSQTHRYLASLAEANMVKQDPSGNYDLGPAALQLGLSALARIDVFKEADAAISQFCEESGSSVLIAALGPAGPTIVRWHAGVPPIVTSLTVGSILSLLRSATGQVFLGFRPLRQMQLLIDKERAATTASALVDVAGLRDMVRKDGHASVGGTLIPGLSAVAYPIFDVQGEAVLVATLVATSQTTAAIFKSGGDALEKICAEVSARVGGTQS